MLIGKRTIIYYLNNSKHLHFSERSFTHSSLTANIYNSSPGIMHAITLNLVSNGFYRSNGVISFSVEEQLRIEIVLPNNSIYIRFNALVTKEPLRDMVKRAQDFSQIASKNIQF